MRTMLAALALLIALPLAATAQAPNGPYLFDLIAKPAFRASFEAMIKDERNVDAWIRDYTRTKDGPATPSKVIQRDGRSFIGAGVCKRHDCGDNQLRVLFTQDGSKAVGMLITSRGQRFFGKPSLAEKALLLEVE